MRQRERRVQSRQRQGLLRQHDVAEKHLFPELLAFVNAPPISPDLLDLQALLRQKLNYAIDHAGLFAVSNWRRYTILRTVVKDDKAGTIEMREIPAGDDPWNQHLYALTELARLKRSRDLRRCDYGACGRIFLRNRTHRFFCSANCRQAKRAERDYHYS